MSDTVIAAVITVGGMLGVVIVTAIFEHLRMNKMIRLQTNVGREDRWRDRLLDIVSELVAVTDPQINRKPDYKRAVALIQQAQLLLDFNEGKAADLNGALNAFGLTLNQFVGEVADDDLDRLEQHRVLLAVHAGVIDATKAVLGTGEFPNPETIGP